MLSKSTLIKIAVGVLVIAVIWTIMKLRKSSASPDRKVIVTAMPVMGGDIGGLAEDDDDYGVITTQAPGAKEGYADWSADEAGEVDEEEFTEYSSPEFKSDLLE